jgi:uncharacterized protein (DUF302 family)
MPNSPVPQPTTRNVPVQRFSVVSARSFGDIRASLEAVIGQPDMSAFRKKVGAAETLADLEKVVAAAIGSSGLMEFTRFDLGEILRKEQGGAGRRCERLVVGNPLIMKEMAKHVPDTGSYAPVDILIDERADGVHLSYDRMSSLLAPYGRPEAQKVAESLDAKVEALLQEAATG